jgi:hypothetical protein
VHFPLDFFSPKCHLLKQDNKIRENAFFGLKADGNHYAIPKSNFETNKMKFSR